MTYSNSIDNINIGLYPNIIDIVDKCYISGKSLYIELKKDKKDIIIVTIKTDYTSFRKEIEKLLKEKHVEKEKIKDILCMVDNSHEIIYKDISTTNTSTTVVVNDSDNKSESDQSDLSDQEIIETVNVSQCLKLNSGKVQVPGNIVGISEPYKVVYQIINNCSCGKNIKSFNPPLFALPKDGYTCKKCNETIKIDKNTIKYKNAITVQIQDNEKFNDIEKITCILLDPDTENIRVGEKVIITGDIHILPKFNKNLLAPMVFAYQLEYENKDEVVINENDIQTIKRFAKLKGSTIIESLIELFDKSIIGNNLAKESLLYGLVSAGNDLADIKKHKTRNRINILLAGNPGLGKSSLLKKAITLKQNSRYESVQHSTAKSLTAIVLQENEQHFLRLGPIPIAKGSICGLNEIGTMTSDDQNHLLDIMEEGEFTINKHGFSSKIQSPTTIIASSNLKNSDLYGFEYYPSLLPLERQLLDRFDLIVILKDNGDPKALEEYTEKKTELQSKFIPIYDILLQKYIKYARTIKPKISPESIKMIQQYYINSCHQTNPNSESKRKLETIMRLCKAVSKLQLKETVESEDVVRATRFYNAMIFNYMGPTATAPIPKDPVRLIIEKCETLLRDEEKSNSIYRTNKASLC